MRRSTAMTITALASLAPPVVLLASTTATGAGETCRGVPATIVGSPGTRIVGTEGDDVIVTNQGRPVSALAGDDVICVTGPDMRNRVRHVRVDAGAGDDVVDGTAARSWWVEAELGPGSDRFEGGPAADRVRAGHFPSEGGAFVDDAPDVLIGGGGDDHFTSGQTGLDNADVLDGGTGDDHVIFFGFQAPDGTLAGGDGADSLALELGPGHNVLDNVAGRLTTAGTVRLSWSGMENFSEFGLPAEGLTALEFRGNGADETIELEGFPPEGSRLDAGAGRDELVVTTTGLGGELVDWDLRDGRMLLDDVTVLPAAGFEDAYIVASRVRMTGTDGPNVLVAASCEATLVGRGGDDTLRLTGYDPIIDDLAGCAQTRTTTTMVGGGGDDRLLSNGDRDRMAGGPGRDRFSSGSGSDVLRGGSGHDRADAGRGNDTFLGGPGRDRVDGYFGTDRCVAERKTRCERT